MAASSKSTFHPGLHSCWRHDENGDRSLVLKPGDMTPASSSSLGGYPGLPFNYDARCSCCWLHVSHSKALHEAKLAGS